METFFLAETVKYLYLLQDPDTEVDILHKVIKRYGAGGLSLAWLFRSMDFSPHNAMFYFFQHVFNTEAHPMRMFNVLNPAAFQR